MVSKIPISTPKYNHSFPRTRINIMQRLCVVKRRKLQLYLHEEMHVFRTSVVRPCQ